MQQNDPKGAPVKTQEEIDEMRKQIALSNEYENQLKKQIEEEMPFVTEVLETQVVMNEYIGTKFEDSFAVLIKPTSDGGRGYQKIRRLRRDGNCFYRAFLFQTFEHYAL